MASLNKCIFIGNLTRDPELQYTPKGTAVARLGIAVNHVYFNSNDEKCEEVLFLDCDAWGKTAEIANEYLKKGSQVCFEGRLKLDSWEDKQTGDKRYKHKLIVEKLVMLGSTGGGKNPDDDDDPRGSSYRQSSGQSSSPPARPSTPPPKKHDPDLDPPEDDIPF